jgi:hypothetical protein
MLRRYIIIKYDAGGLNWSTDLRGRYFLDGGERWRTDKRA